MDWTRGQTVGRGSSGTVSIATSRLAGDILAVKSAELVRSQSLQREQKILSNLSNPFIVGYRGCSISSENNEFVYNLFMEYVPGGDLADEIHRHGGRMDEPTIGFYTCQILRGLEYLHSNGIVHCDIKCRNILAGKSSAKIADFGCAKLINLTDSAAAPIGGTPIFMAPEVARAEEQGFPADVWALGCTIIEMSTGVSPWTDAKDPVSILYRIAFSGDLPEFPDFLSEQANDFLSKCLRRDPKRRWTAKQLLTHPFIEQFNSPPTIIHQDSYTNSPTSILDQDFWRSVEECDSISTQKTRSLNSPASRIGQLLPSQRLSASWTWDKGWIIIRRSN